VALQIQLHVAFAPASHSPTSFCFHLAGLRKTKMTLDTSTPQSYVKNTSMPQSYVKDTSTPQSNVKDTSMPQSCVKDCMN